MNTKRSSNETRGILIKAANRLVLERGINQLTLELVAQEAGVSKGGLLYHFPNKEALIESMVEHYLTGFEARLDSTLAQSENTDDRAWLRAYILASIEATPEENAISAALLAAVSINPALLNPMRERYAAWQQRLNAMDDSATANIIRLTLDGLWLADLMGFAPPDAQQRQQLLARLLQMID